MCSYLQTARLSVALLNGSACTLVLVLFAEKDHLSPPVGVDVSDYVPPSISNIWVKGNAKKTLFIDYSFTGYLVLSDFPYLIVTLVKV